MDEAIGRRLQEAGIELADPAPPRFHYVTATHCGDIYFFSGKTSLRDGTVLHAGRLGVDISPQQGRAAARQAAVNLLSAIDAELGLENVHQVLKVNGYVAGSPDFVQQPEVVDAASQLIVDILGDAGRHARTAVGVASLPSNSPVEVEAVVQAVQLVKASGTTPSEGAPA